MIVGWVWFDVIVCVCDIVEGFGIELKSFESVKFNLCMCFFVCGNLWILEFVWCEFLFSIDNVWVDKMIYIFIEYMVWVILIEELMY